jgi:hypothetical protein
LEAYSKADKKIVVFDFDKTLTYKDTLLGFFICASGPGILMPLKVFAYFVCMLLAKLKITSNDGLKKFGISIFLKNKSEVQIREAAYLYRKKIRLNNVYERYNFNNDHHVFIVSASFSEYIKPIFPNHIRVMGSELEYANGLVKGLQFNCYREKKLSALMGEGILEIDEFYTDSYSDYPLATIAKKIFIVKGNRIIQCNDRSEFNAFFNRKPTNVL